MNRLLKHNWMVLVVGLMLAVPALPADAADKIMCPSPAQSFDDVDAGNPHSYDIDCLASLSVVDSGGAFSPDQNLTRWKMSQWLTRSAKWLQGLPQDPPVTFLDTATLSAEAQTAVEQARMLGITEGVGYNLYDPYGTVPRWQMALFLTRFLVAIGVDLPVPSDSGFTDLGGLSPESLNAISQLRTLEITQGTSATTFSPYGAVTREQMASFVARTLDRGWVLNPDLYVDECNDVIPDGGTDEVRWCTGDDFWVPSEPFRIRVNIKYVEPINSTQLAILEGISWEIFVDFVPYEETVRIVRLPGVTYKFSEITIPGSTNYTHIQADYYFEDELFFVTELVR